MLERTKEISNSAELDAALALAGDDLVMLAIESDEECYAGESAWSGSDAKMASCKQLSASLARIAREAEDVTFLKLDVVGHEARERSPRTSACTSSRRTSTTSTVN